MWFIPRISGDFRRNYWQSSHCSEENRSHSCVVLWYSRWEILVYQRLCSKIFNFSRTNQVRTQSSLGGFWILLCFQWRTPQIWWELHWQNIPRVRAEDSLRLHRGQVSCHSTRQEGGRDGEAGRVLQGGRSPGRHRADLLQDWMEEKDLASQLWLQSQSSVLPGQAGGYSHENGAIWLSGQTSCSSWAFWNFKIPLPWHLVERSKTFTLLNFLNLLHLSLFRLFTKFNSSLSYLLIPKIRSNIYETLVQY